MTTNTRPPRSRTVRPDPASLPPLELTASRRRMLELLHHYRYLTAPLLAVAYGHDEGRSGRGLSHVRHELGRLWKHGYVERHYESKRPTGEGSDQYIYTVTKEGGRAVLPPEQYAADRYLIYRRTQRQRGNYDHHLALAALQLILEHGQQPWTVARFRSDERRERIRARLARGTDYTVQPDAWVTIRRPNGQQTLYLFEVDLAHKNNKRTDSRSEAYMLYLSRELEQLKAREKVNGVVVVFVGPDADAVGRLIERTGQKILDLRLGRRELPLLLFWNMEDWYETRKHSRKQHTGTPTEITRTWTTPSLRAPAAVVTDASLANVRGNLRLLVESTG